MNLKSVAMFSSVLVFSLGGLAGGIDSAAAAASASTITCTINVQYPHGSTHVSGTINVVSTVSCTAPVPRIQQRTALYKSGGSSWWGTPVDKNGVAAVQSNAATSCSQAPGQFYGVAVTTINFPAGYSPSTHTGNTYGETRDVTCTGASRTIPSSSDEQGVVYVVTAEKLG